MVPDETLARMQPACVHVAENPSNVPFSGWVTTTSSEARMTPLPTGTSAVATRALGLWPVPPSLPPVEVADGGSSAPALEDPPPPQAVRSGTVRPPSAAAVRTRRRGVPGSVTGAPRGGLRVVRDVRR